MTVSILLFHNKFVWEGVSLLQPSFVLGRSDNLAKGWEFVLLSILVHTIDFAKTEALFQELYHFISFHIWLAG